VTLVCQNEAGLLQIDLLRKL